MRRTGQRGLTLLETLVALVILAGAFAAALAMMRTADRLTASAQHRQALVDNAYGLSYVRALVEGAAPVVQSAQGGVPILDFSGAPDALSFFSAHFAAADRPPLKRTTLRIVDGEIQLLRAGDAAPPRTLAKLDRASRFLFGEIGPDGALAFRDDWTGRTKLPVVVIIAQKDGSADAQQPMIAAFPRLSTEY